jgi:arylsulfatase
VAEAGLDEQRRDGRRRAGEPGREPEPQGEDLGGVGHLGGHAAQIVQMLLERLRDGGLEELRLRREVVVEGPETHVRRVGDLLDADVGGALLGEDGAGGPDERRTGARLAPVQTAAARAGRRHRRTTPTAVVPTAQAGAGPSGPADTATVLTLASVMTERSEGDLPRHRGGRWCPPVLAGRGTRPPRGAAMRQPNILLITTDEERFRIPTPAGFSLPARDRLTAAGVSFERFYVASAMCSSSRSVIYTGQHVPLTEIYDNDNMPYIRPLDPALGTLGGMLGSAGYHCVYQGKWHLSNAYRAPGDQRSTVDALRPYGFLSFNDWGDIDGGAWAGLRVDPVIAGQAARWLRNEAAGVAAEQPWFMAVNFVNPHDIMSFDYGGRAAIAPPPNLAEAVRVLPPADIPVYERTWDLAAPDTLDDDLSGAAPAVHEFTAVVRAMFGDVPGEEEWVAGLNFYLNCIRDVDRSVGTVLDALVASGQADSTVIVFTSDHGELAGSHGLRQKGNLVYDENFHVPLLVVHPDVAGGSRTGALASAVDLAATLLDIAGVDGSEVATRFPALRGHSLRPVLEAGRPVREGVLTAVESLVTLDGSYWQAMAAPDAPMRVQSGELRPDWDKRGFLRGYTDERYTFGRYFSPLAPNRPGTVEALQADNDVVLYDRLTDPGETTDLAADPGHRALVEEYRRRLERLIDDEIGPDTRAWVPERPRLVGVPRWHGDAA